MGVGDLNNDGTADLLWQNLEQSGHAWSLAGREQLDYLGLAPLRRSNPVATAGRGQCRRRNRHQRPAVGRSLQRPGGSLGHPERRGNRLVDAGIRLNWYGLPCESPLASPNPLPPVLRTPPTATLLNSIDDSGNLAPFSPGGHAGNLRRGSSRAVVIIIEALYRASAEHF